MKSIASSECRCPVCEGSLSDLADSLCIEFAANAEKFFWRGFVGGIVFTLVFGTTLLFLTGVL